MLDCNLQLLAAFSNASRALSKIFRASKVAGASAIASKVPLRLLRTFPRVTNPTVQRGQGRRREPGSRIRMYTPKIKERIGDLVNDSQSTVGSTATLPVQWRKSRPK